MLGKLFKILDDDNSKSLDPQEWAKCCKDLRMDMNPQEVDILFKLFDRDDWPKYFFPDQ